MLRHIAARSSPNPLGRTPPLEDGEHAAKATNRRTTKYIWEDGVRTEVSCSCSYCTTPSGSEYETDFGNEIKEAYNTLIKMGGRPTREIQLDPGLPDPIEAQRGLRHYATFWRAQLTFKHELDRWKKFRDHQQEARARPEEFHTYCQSVRDYRRENEMEGEIDLHLQWDQQTKLDEWKEYQFFQHRQLAGPRARIERRIKRAQKQLDTGDLRIEGSAWYDIHSANLDLKELDDLWEWVEQQLLQIASNPAISVLENKSSDRLHHDQAKRDRSRPLRNHTASAVSRPSGSSKAGGQERKQRKTRSILSPVNPSRISKAPEKKRTGRRKVSISYNTSQSAEKTTIDPSVSEPGCKRTSKVKSIMPTPLRPIHSSRVSKSGSKRSTELHANGTKLGPTLARIRLGKHASPAPTESPKISKPTTGPRCNARIAEREPHLKGTWVPPGTVKAIDVQDPEVVRARQPLKEPKQQEKRSLTKTTTRKNGRPTEEYPPTSSKPQGVTKRRAYSRSRRLNA